MSKQPLLVHLSPHYPPYVGGLERVARTIAEAMAAAGHRVLVLASSQGDRRGSNTVGNLTVKRLASFEFAHTPFAPGLFWELMKLPKDSILHLHLSQAYWPELVMLAARVRNLRYVVHFHLDVGPSGPFGTLFLLYKRLAWVPLFRGASRIIVCAEDQASVLQKKYGVRSDRISIIPNAVKADFFVRRDYVPHEDVFRLLYVGRLARQKRVERLIEAVAQLKVPAHLTVVGDGEERRALEKLVAEHSRHNVTFVGSKNDAEMKAYHASNDMLLISSDREGGTPLVVLEAMAGGLPVVGTNVSGIAGLLGDTGILVNEPYVEQFVQVIEMLWEKKRLLSDLSRASAAKARLHTVDVFVGRIQAAYDGVAAKARPAVLDRAPAFGGLAAAMLAWSAFTVLSALQFNSYQMLNIVGFLSLVLVPGYLTVLAIRLKSMPLWGSLSLVIGFGVLELMLAGLLGNTVFPLLGIAQPLYGPYILIETTLLVYALAIVCILRAKVEYVPFDFSFLGKTGDVVLAFFPSVFVAMSAFGAILLNNGGSSWLTYAMLVGIGAYAGLLMWRAKRIHPDAVATALFFMGLSLLFMTSLRGWFTTGHDVQREFRVFQLTKHNGYWSIANFHDAYNACISITILPVMFARTLKFSDPYAYKVFFQILFATVPSVLYLTTRRFVSSTLAVMNAIYFMAFPTFFGDMPMLDRQEIAFMFVAIMTYLAFATDISLKLRRRLFVSLGFGLVLSHYSTTYTVILLMLILLFTRPIVRLLAKWGWFKRAGVALTPSGPVPRGYVITVPVVIILGGASFLWSSVLTDTSSNSLYRVVVKTVAVMRSNVREDAQSGTVLYSLFSWHKSQTPAELLAEYQNKVVEKARGRELPGTFFAPAEYRKDEVTASKPVVLELTPVGRWLQSLGVDVAAFNYDFRQGTAKLLQILIFVGMGACLLGRRFLRRKLDLEYGLMAIASLLFILALVLLPVLSVEYGIMRAFEQSLVFMGIFIVLGSLAWPLGASDRVRIGIGAVMAVVFLYSSTGVFTQALGAYGPQLHLNNSGDYYDEYYLHRGEVLGVEWLSEIKSNDPHFEYQASVQSDRFLSSKVSSIAGTNVLFDIYPGLVRKYAYVFLGYANIHKRVSATDYNDSSFFYSYPVDFLDEQKDRLYDNGDSRVYR